MCPPRRAPRATPDRPTQSPFSTKTPCPAVSVSTPSSAPRSTVTWPWWWASTRAGTWRSHIRQRRAVRSLGCDCPEGAASLAVMPANPLTDPQWATETTDKLVSVIDTVRAQTTQKVVYAARGAVFGVIAAMLGVFIAVVLLVGLIRGVQALLELAVGWDRAVYLSYLIIGALFSVVGLVFFRK